MIKRASFSTVCADDVDASARAEIKFIGADETVIDAVYRRAGVDKLITVNAADARFNKEGSVFYFYRDPLSCTGVA